MVKRPTESGGEPSSSNRGASAGVKARQLISEVKSMKTHIGILVLVIFLNACASTVPLSSPTSATPTASRLSFVDIPQFDRNLSANLETSLPSVDVAFYEKVSPNHVPERLQKWLSAVERTGGAIRVIPPPNEITPKDPFFLLSLLGSLVSSIKNLTELQSDRLLNAARGHDALIALERNAQGEVIITKIEFIKK